MQIDRRESHRAYLAGGIKRRLRHGHYGSAGNTADVIITHGKITTLECAAEPGALIGVGTGGKPLRTAKHKTLRRESAQIGVTRILLQRIRHKTVAGFCVAHLQGW